MKVNGKTFWIFASSACLVLFGLQYCTTHIDKIMAARGDYYFARNDVKNAERFYESAFELGVKDSNRRNNYVNMIINSPLTSDAQGKLVKFINYPVEDGAKLKAEYFVYDMKREIFRKYQNNYVRKAVYNGKIIRWGELPITYAFKSDEEIPGYYIDEAENAFRDWEKALDHEIYFKRVDQKPNIILEYVPNKKISDENQKYVAAYTKPDITSDNKLVDMHIKFYIKDVEDKYLTKNQIYNTSLHEIAHALGVMGHSEERKDLMYMSKDSILSGEDERAVLTAGDINTMKLLYSIKPDITNSNNTKSSYIPYVVLGNDKEVTNSKIREAKYYIKKAPNLPMGYIDLAIGYVSAQDYASAIKTLERALQVADSNEILSIIYYNLAVAYYYIDNNELALDNILKSIKIQDSEDKRYLLADIYTKMNDITNAVHEYGGLIKQHPKNADYTIALANIYVQRHEYMNARKVLKNYFNNNPAEKSNPRFAPYGIIRLGL